MERDKEGEREKRKEISKEKRKERKGKERKGKERKGKERKEGKEEGRIGLGVDKKNLRMEPGALHPQILS